VLRRACELSAGTLRLEPRAVATDGEFLFVWGRVTAQRPGKSLDCERAGRMRTCTCAKHTVCACDFVKTYEI